MSVQRAVIVGMSGAGKSTLARVLGEKWKLPAVHMDNIYHLPGWIARPDEDVQRDFDALAATPKWVADGNYFRLSHALRERADILIFLDFGRIYCIAQVLKRFALHRTGLRKRPDLAEGFHEEFTPAFFMWIWNWRRTKRQRWLDEVEKFGPRGIILRNRREVTQWFNQL